MAFIDIVVAISVCMDFYFEIPYFSDDPVIDHTQQWNLWVLQPKKTEGYKVTDSCKKLVNVFMDTLKFNVYPRKFGGSFLHKKLPPNHEGWRKADISFFSVKERNKKKDYLSFQR